MFVKRGFKALGSLIRSDPSEPEEDPPPAESTIPAPANSAAPPEGTP
jgi:hypothetical protein